MPAGGLPGPSCESTALARRSPVAALCTRARHRGACRPPGGNMAMPAAVQKTRRCTSALRSTGLSLRSAWRSTVDYQPSWRKSSTLTSAAAGWRRAASSSSVGIAGTRCSSPSAASGEGSALVVSGGA